MIDESVLDASIESAGIDSDSVVVEIGAGLGALTQKLAQKAKRVISFEVDPSLRPILQETLAGLNTVELHFADFRAIDLDEILEADARYRVVANLPYNAGTHIIARMMPRVWPMMVKSDSPVRPSWALSSASGRVSASVFV